MFCSGLIDRIKFILLKIINEKKIKLSSLKTDNNASLLAKPDPHTHTHTKN